MIFSNHTIPSSLPFARSPRLGLNCRRKLAAAPDLLRNKKSKRRRLAQCQCLMPSKFEMLSSVAHKSDVAAGSVEYPEDDGSRCAVRDTKRQILHVLEYGLRIFLVADSLHLRATRARKRLLRMHFQGFVSMHFRGISCCPESTRCVPISMFGRGVELHEQVACTIRK